MRTRSLLALTALAGVALVLAGCGNKKTTANKPQVAEKYQALPKREVPDWLKGSLFEQVDLTTTEPFRVNNFGLVMMQHPTGDAVTAPNLVREYMIREMQKRGYGSKNVPGFENATPDLVLRDPRYAIVRVDAYIPPGAYAGQSIDVQVSALEDSNTTSLATGRLFTTFLMPNGANERNPGSAIDILAEARGYVFVNPAYTLEGETPSPDQRRSLTTGIILNGGRVERARPLGLRVRAAERRMARMIEQRIDQLTADGTAASAMDEGLVYVNVPAKYKGDWEHFAGVMLHTYFSTDAGFALLKAREIAAEAVKPDAPLLDISYSFEALGEPALPEILPLLTHKTPEVAFAAARAAAFIGDGSAESALYAMARDTTNPFRLNAVTTLGALSASPSVRTALRDLLSADDSQVRIAAYSALAKAQDTSIYSKKIGDKFLLDIVPSKGASLIYATRSGLPRIAFIGPTAKLQASAFFTAMNHALSISQSGDRPDLMTIYYRGNASTSVQQLTTTDLPEIVARFGGEGPPGQPKFAFTYGEIVALLGKMSDAGILQSQSDAKATFVLQDAPGGWNRDVETAPIIPDGPRPITGEPDAIGSR